jgi:hypothetical protein
MRAAVIKSPLDRSFV